MILREIFLRFNRNGLCEFLSSRAEWYKQRIAQIPLGGHHMQRVLDVVAMFRGTQFTILDEREIHPQTGKPMRSEFRG